MITIRPENPGDVDTLFQVYLLAFGRIQEAALVHSLRENQGLLLSLVAISEGSLVVGGVAFSPVTLEPTVNRLHLAGLAPLAVLPSYQRRGIGSRLVQVGLQQCQEQGVDAVFLLGEPEFYGKFGFGPASSFGIRCEFEIPDRYWLVVELNPGALQEVRGLVKYRPEFQSL
jgi:putative acetyltransferase